MRDNIMFYPAIVVLIVAAAAAAFLITEWIKAKKESVTECHDNNIKEEK